MGGIHAWRWPIGEERVRVVFGSEAAGGGCTVFIPSLNRERNAQLRIIFEQCEDGRRRP